MAVREIVMDTETTGLSPKSGDRIIEIGCIEIIDGVVTGESFHTYLNPKTKEVSRNAFEVHGISTQFLADKPAFVDIVDGFLKFIHTSTLIIHNAAFDIGFLNHELGFIGYSHIDINRVIDTLLIARKEFPGSPANLDALCQRFGINLNKRKKHGALLDAELLAWVYLNLKKAKQNSIGFDTMPKSNVIRTYHKPRYFPPNVEEKEAHDMMIAHMKHPMWLKEGTGQ